MAGTFQAFCPVATVAIAITTGTVANATILGGRSNLLITNGYSDYIFVRIAGGNASRLDVPVPDGARIMLDCPANIMSVPIYPDGAGGTVFATRGDGPHY